MNERWWPVGPSITIFMFLLAVPVGVVYLLSVETQIPAFVWVLGIAFVLAAALTLAELVWGRRHGNVLNHTDILSAFFGIFVTGTIGNGIVIVVLAPLSESVSESLGTSFWPTGLPIAIQVILGLVISDLVMYPIHRYMHKHDGLWRVHVVHHSISDLRPARNFLQHPFEVLLLGVVPAIPFVLFGAPTIVAVMVGSIRVIVGTIDHSTLPLRTGWLDYVIHTPNDHWWHHNLEDSGGANFTTVVIEIDIMFKTFKKPPADNPVPTQTGIPEPDIAPNKYARQLAVPFHWKSVKESGHA